MRQFEFKEHIIQVYLQCYGLPPKRAGLIESSQGLRWYARSRKWKRNLDDIRFDGVKHYLIEIPDNKKGDAPENLAPKSHFLNAVNVMLDYLWAAI